MKASPPRIVVIAAALTGLYAWAVFASTFSHPGSIGLNYTAPGTDFMVFHAAIGLATAGHAQAIFNADHFTAYLNRIFAGRLPHPLTFRPWVYPPTFLPMLLPFAWMGFTTAYASFEFITAGLLWLALRTQPDKPHAALPITAAALLSPGASVTVVQGQCGFLVPALLVGGFRLVGRHPLLGGFCLGLVTFKPQFFLMVPIALFAQRQWRAVAAVIGTSFAMMLISVLLFGTAPWVFWVREVLPNYIHPSREWVGTARIWGNSVWTCAVLLGAGTGLASIMQALASLGAGAAVYLAFRSSIAIDRQISVLLAAALLANPHWAAYDGVMAVVAAGLWLASEDGAETGFWLFGLSIWIIPLISPPAVAVAGRFAPLLLAGLIWLAGRRLSDRALTDQRMIQS